MKKENYLKSSHEQIQEMLKLYQAGLSLEEIKRRTNRNRKTIYYWVHKYKLNRELFPKVKPPIIKPIIEPVKIEPLKVVEKPEVRKDICIKCGKPKTDKKWILTNYCSISCWWKFHLPEEKYYSR